MKSSKGHNLVTKQQGQKAEVSEQGTGCKTVPTLERSLYLIISEHIKKLFSHTH